MPRTKASAKKSQSMANSDSQPTASIVAFESSRTLHLDLEARVRQRAYEIFEERGGLHGYAEEDWLRAEAEILGHREKLTA